MRPGKHKRGTLLVVHWMDAVTHEDGWATLDANDMVCEPVQSVGFVLGLSKQAITIAADIGENDVDGHTNRAITIPFGMIESIDEVDLS